MATYRWYIIGTRRDSETVQILGWSRDRIAALGRPGVIAVYYASSRRMAARLAKADRGFEIKWRKY